MITFPSSSAADRIPCPTGLSWVGRRICSIAFPILLALCVTSVSQSEDDLRLLRAKAIRLAVQRVAPSIVRVEKFGVAEAGGEVADDAPTVAIAVDDKRHYVASSLVNRQTPTAIVLVSADGTRSTAKIVATDYRRQLVLLEAAEELPVKPADLTETPVSIGQTVIAVGRIAGDGSTAVSSGVLSAEDRLWGIALQTDARVSSVFYGGPLIDLKGRILGVLVPAVPDDAGEDITAWYDSGVAFAIPGAAIVQRLPSMLRGEDVHAGLVGIVAKSSDPYVENTEISAVRPRSPAALSEFLPGDKVQSIDGKLVRSHREVKQILGAKDAGQSVVFELTRGDAVVSKTVELVKSIPPLRPQWLGITARDEKSETGTAVVVTGVFENAPATNDINTGDQIVAIDGSPVGDVSSMRRRIFAADPDKPLQIDLIRKQDRTGQGEPVVSEISINTADLAEDIPAVLPESLQFVMDKETNWGVTDLTLPDLANKAAMIGPTPLKDQQAETRIYGLLLVMADPGDSDLKKVAGTWEKVASNAGVIVCVVGPSKEERWQPEEIDVASRVVASLTKTYAIDSLMVAIAGAGSGAGGSMAMASAIGRPGSFVGLAVLADVTPPAIRLVENDASARFRCSFVRGESR